MGNPYAPKPPGSTPHRPVATGSPQDGQDGGLPPQSPAPQPLPGQPVTPAPGDHGQPGPAGAPGGWDGRGAPRAPRPPVDPEKARLATRGVMIFGLYMLASLLLSSVALPWRMLSVAVGVAALVVGVRALRTVWRAGLRGGLVVVLSAGMLMTVILGLSTLAVIPVWGIETDRQSCLDEAITITAQTSCQTTYETAIDDYRSSLTD